MTRYMLKTVGAHMAAYGDFIWPQSGPVEAPDWDPTSNCGGGLHGLLNGEGDGSLLSSKSDAVWLVCAIPDDAVVVDLDGKIKVNRCDVVYAGGRDGAIAHLESLVGAHGPMVFARRTAGDRGVAVAGDFGTATVGDDGVASAGYRGVASAGYRGTVMAGDCGTISVAWHDGARRRIAVGHVGEDDILAGVRYRCRSGELVPCSNIVDDDDHHHHGDDSTS